ncbi:hypothetical protein GOODEAATRI_018464, partial [Goodea atripinnis]
LKGVLVQREEASVCDVFSGQAVPAEAGNFLHSHCVNTCPSVDPPASRVKGGAKWLFEPALTRQQCGKNTQLKPHTCSGWHQQRCLFNPSGRSASSAFLKIPNAKAVFFVATAAWKAHWWVRCSAPRARNGVVADIQKMSSASLLLIWDAVVGPLLPSSSGVESSDSRPTSKNEMASSSE